MHFFSLTALLLLLLTSCSMPDENVTKEEALLLSRAIDSAVSYKKPYYFNSLFDEKSFADKVVRQAGDNAPPGMRKEIKGSLAQSEMGDKIILSVQANGMYELVRYYEKNKVQHLLYRLYSDGGLNYHDFELVKRNGKVAIADMFIYLSGEDFSKTISDLLLSFSGNNGLLSSERFSQMQKVRNMKEMIERNETQKALKYYNGLAKDLKEQKAIGLMYITLCSQLGDESYSKAISEFQTRYPDEPNMHLMMVDAYILRKDYPKAIESINEVDRLTHTDPFLDYIRALIYNLMDKPGEARKHLEKLYRNMPGFDDGALELIANSLAAGEDTKAGQLVKEYEDNKKFDQSLLDNYLYTQPQFSRTNKTK